MAALLKIKNHEVLLAVVALVFLALIVGYFAWGITDIISGVDRAINAKGAAPAPAATFDIAAAKKLNLQNTAQASGTPNL